MPGLVTYHLEPWARYWPECETIWRQHYEEFRPFHLGRLPFGPDIEMYRQADLDGRLQILVARAEGKMVGYCLVLIRRHPHYAMVCGFEDSYYVLPAWRRGFNGVRLIKRSVEALQRRGIVMSYWMTKEFNSIERVFRWLGFTRCDSVFYCWKGGD